MVDDLFPDRPSAPVGVRALKEHRSLSSVRDTLTSRKADEGIVQRITSLVDGWRNDADSVEPYVCMRELLEELRRIPHGDERIYAMRDVVATLGQPEMLATFLDALRHSVLRNNTREQAACRDKLLNVRMHSIYGWCGNTLIVESLDQPTTGTHPSIPGLAERLGNSATAWNLTVHIWQPNLTARAFSVDGAGLSEGAILEPPHSHPFEFVSTVVKGEFWQSIYAPRSEAPDRVRGYYDGTPLEHVDSVWPPHYFRRSQILDTLEHRVSLKQGDAYYMPCDWIHDVEVDAEIAMRSPAITLFLSSEYMVMNDVYMTRAMIEYHDAHPDIKGEARPIPEEAWHEKLRAISAYLRGESPTLSLNEIVGWNGEYGFFHKTPARAGGGT